VVDKKGTREVAEAYLDSIGICILAFGLSR